MQNILITGATCNIGYQVIRYLFEWNTQNRVIAGVRNIEKGKASLSHIGQLEFREFDFENKDFYTVTRLINQTLNTDIKYESVNPIRFYRIKRKEGLPKDKILVMLMLHFLPRFQKEPQISGFYEQLTGKKPTSLKGFIDREGDTFTKLKGWCRGEIIKKVGMITCLSGKFTIPLERLPVLPG